MATPTDNMDESRQHSLPRAVRVTEHLANERTFLAWIRTSISIVTLGFVVAKFSVWLRQFLVTVAPSSSAAERLPRSSLSLPAGLALMLLGALTAAVALWRHRETDRAIERGDYHATHGLSTLVTLVVIIVATVLVVYLYSTSGRL